MTSSTLFDTLTTWPAMPQPEMPEMPEMPWSEMPRLPPLHIGGNLQLTPIKDHVMERNSLLREKDSESFMSTPSREQKSEGLAIDPGEVFSEKGATHSEQRYIIGDDAEKCARRKQVLVALEEAKKDAIHSIAQLPVQAVTAGAGLWSVASGIVENLTPLKEPIISSLSATPARAEPPQHSQTSNGFEGESPRQAGRVIEVSTEPAQAGSRGPEDDTSSESASPSICSPPLHTGAEQDRDVNGAN